MKRLWRSLRGWIILLAVIGGIYAFLHLVVMVPKPIPVRVHEAGVGVVERTVSNTKAGSIRSRLSSELSADSAGRVVEILHREGETVKADEPILKLDDRTAKAGLAVLEKEHLNSFALKAQAEASAKDAVREHNRLKELSAEGTISDQELDRAATQVDLTRAALESAVARVEQQAARLEEARLELKKLTLQAPFDGVITELYVEVGEWAVPGKPLVKLIDPGKLYVRSELDEVDIGDLRVGLPVRMKLDPFKGKTFAGKITRISPYISEVLEQNRTIEVEVEFTDGTELGELRPGTSADVEVILEKTSPDTLRIPTLAIMEGNKVLVAENGTAREVEIETGLRNWDFTEVKAGLEKGTPVIVSLDREEVRAGALVVIEEEENGR